MNQAFTPKEQPADQGTQAPRRFDFIEKNPTTEDFYRLFQSEFAAIIIDNFLSPEECLALQKGIDAIGLQSYRYASDAIPKAKHIFDTHYHYEQEDPANYFALAATNNAHYLDFCKGAGVDPALRVQQYLTKSFQKPVTYATQDHQAYTYAMVRELQSSALLHADFARFLPDYWSISDTTAQYAWNIYLTDPIEGGECVVYDKQWELSDDRYIIKDTYGYDTAVVEGCTAVAISPKPGSLVIFNCRNFHEVKESSHLRLSVGGHVGINDKDEIYMWV